MKNIIKVLLALSGVIVASAFYLFYFIHSSYYQGVRSAESYKYAKTVTASLSKYYSAHLKYPDSMDELNPEKSEQQYIGKMTFDNQAGVLKIQLAGKSLSEWVLIFSHQIKHGNGLSYICRPLNVPTEYIPKECIEKKTDSNLAPQPTVYDAE